MFTLFIANDSTKCGYYLNTFNLPFRFGHIRMLNIILNVGHMQNYIWYFEYNYNCMCRET